jgi:predicted nucleic acid-binding protein
MTIVVDASVAVRWFLQLKKANLAEALLKSGERIVAPDLVLAEIANAAWKAAVFGGVSTATVTDIVEKSARYFHELMPAEALKDRALEIALALKHPAYDCFYLALAEQRGCRVVTADDRLLRRCAGSLFSPLVTAL